MNFKKIFGGMLSLILAGSVLSIAPPKAIADIGPNPLASLTLEKTFDGTGHGTDTATFITSQNGFKPADDTPTDNVVSSNDTVGYKMDLKIRAGAARTIVLDFSKNNLLNVDFDTFCYNFGAIAAKQVNSTCELQIPTGASGSLTSNIIATAADTAGRIERDQALNISYGIKDSKSYGNTLSEAVTIISAPRADLVIWPGSYPSKTAYKKNFSSAATGFFELIPKELEYENTASKKGVSTAGEYTATIDVSEWPETTVWTLGNTVIEVVDGKLNVKTNGKQKLSYNVPEGWGEAIPDFEKGSSRTLNISMVVDSNSFSSEDFKNNGTGFQPGDNKGQTETTFSSEYGSIAGSPFPNNDYSAIVINRESDPIAEVFSKRVFVPYSTGRSIFEDESRYWDKAQTEKESKSNSPRNVSLGTEFRQELYVYTKNLNEVPETTKVGFTVTDTWNASHQKLDSSRPITVQDSEGKVINRNLYTITYSDTKDADHTNESLWSSTPSDNSQSLRVVFKSAIKHGANSGSNMKIIVHSIVNEDLTSTNWGEDADLVRDKFRGYLIGEGISETVEKESMIDGSVRAVWLGSPELELTHNNDVTPNEATPGSTVDFEINKIRSSNIPVISEGVPAMIELTLDNCVSNPIFDSATQKNYTINYTPAIPGSDGKICGSVDATPGKVVFTGKTSENLKVSNKINDSGYVALPTIKYSVDISKSANGTVTNNAVFTWNDAEAEVIPVSDESAVNVALTNATTQVITSIIPKTEINKTVSFKVDTTDNDSEGQRGSVIVLPRNGDTIFLDELEEDSRNDYLAAGLPEGSSFNGSYSVKNISIDASQSSDSVLYYTTDANPDLNYKGKSWYLVSEAGQNGNPSLSEATAVYLEMETELGSNKNSTVLIDLDTTGNIKDDVYVLWSNGIRSGDNVVQDIPWPANAIVVSSSIAGTVWWDENRDSAITVDGNTPETGIEGVTVSLFEVDENGEPKGSSIATQVTDADGKYLFDSLNSGNYIVEIVNRGENLPEVVNSEIYNNESDVEQTYSYKNKKIEQSNLRSQVINLDVDSNLTEVNYGFFKPNPVIDVDKSVSKQYCSSFDCEVEFKVTVKNSGNTDIDGGVLTDSMSDKFYSTEFLAGEFYDESVKKFVNRSASGGFVIADSGKLYAWGHNNNSSGSTGTNSADSSVPYPKEVVGLDGKKITSVANRAQGGYALTEEGEVYSWGSSSQGANGNNSTGLQGHSAKKVMGLDGIIISEIYPRNNGAYFLSEGGIVYSVGSGANFANANGGTSNNLTVKKAQGLDGVVIERIIPRGDNGAIAIDSNGKVYSVGIGARGSNGNGSTDNNSIFMPVQGLDGKVIVDVKEGPASTSGQNFIALSNDGKVYAWGANTSYSLGNGATGVDNLTAQLVMGIENINISKIYNKFGSGGYALTGDGKVYSWGSNSSGSVGNGSILSTSPKTTASIFSGLENVNITQLDYSASGFFALSDTKEIYVAGTGNSGGLGLGGTTNYGTAQKLSLPNNEVPSKIFSKANTSGSAATGAVVITESGDAYTWGSISNGSGTGLAENSMTPTRVATPESVDIKDINIVSTAPVTFLLTTDGSIYSYGYSTSNAMGNGISGTAHTPLEIIGLKNLFNASTSISSQSTITEGNIVSNELRIPRIPANEQIDVLVKTKVNRNNSDNYFGNQAWFNSDKTPYSGIYNQNKPNALITPDNSNFDSVGILGNNTCNIGDGIDNQGKYPDTTAQSFIDMCDQVAVKIPLITSSLGSITGVAWVDQNKDGIRNDDETLSDGMLVDLFRHGVHIGSTVTDENGFYSFNDLITGNGYTVQFDVQGQSNDKGKNYSVTAKNTTIEDDKSYADPKTYTTPSFSIPSTADRIRDNINIGLIENSASLSVEKTSDYGDSPVFSRDEIGRYIDTATGVTVGGAIPIKVNVTNNGDEPLTNFTFEDISIAGADSYGWICRYLSSDLTVNTVVPVNGVVTCTGYINQLGIDGENYHENIFKINARGQNSLTAVSGEDDWSASFVENNSMWTVNKTSSIPSGETIGILDEVTYTLTAENIGNVSLNNLVIKDSMKHVLDNAELVTDSLDASLTYDEDTSELIWNIAKIPPSETSTVSYTVKVNDVLSEDRVMLNYITDGGSTVTPDVCFDATEFENINGPLYSQDDVKTESLIEGCYTIHEIVDYNPPTLPSLGGKGTQIFIVIGIITLMISAGIYFGLNRKRIRS